MMRILADPDSQHWFYWEIGTVGGEADSWRYAALALAVLSFKIEN